jgi:hypothetical protein
MIAKVTGGEGLDTGLLERAERLEDVLPPIPLYDTADRHRACGRASSRIWTPRRRRCDA